MQVGKALAVWFAVVAVWIGSSVLLNAAPRKVHVVGLGAVKRVPYSRTGDPAGAVVGEESLKIRPLVVDGVVKEWTAGESHDVTDRTFVVRRAIRLNDQLPGEKSNGGNHWVWQRGPWLMVDRISSHVTALKLPDYDPGVSQVSWFRDYAAYCGLTSSAKSLYAVVAQLAVHKPVLAKKLSAFQLERTGPVCAPVQWQREPFRVTFNASGMEAVSFEIVPGSAVLVEDSDDAPETAAPGKAN
jgi:hypothetical protein